MIDYPAAIYITEKQEVVVISGGEITIYDNLLIPMVRYNISETPEKGKHFKSSTGKNLYVEKTLDTNIKFRDINGIIIPAEDYVYSVCLNYPDDLKKLSNNKDPYPMFFDIETRSTEDHFPNPERDDIISIQIKYPDTDPIILLQEDDDQDDLNLIYRFGEYIAKSPTGRSPDYIVGYFHTRFDNPYIMFRLKVHKKADDWIRSVMSKRYPGLKGNRLFTAKLMSKAKISDEEGDKRYRRSEIYEMIPGLYSVDIYHLAQTDYALRYLKNRKMKTVAEFYKCPFIFDIPIEEKTNMKDLIENDPDRFMKYATSDVLITEFLYNLYEPRLIATSNLMKVPLTMASVLKSGQRANLFMARVMIENGYFPYQQNAEKYGHLYERAPKYQGAIVECKKHGYFPRIVYLDATAMYPNIIHDFNLSFDKTRYIGEIEYSDWEYDKEIRVENKEGNLKRVYIPDNNYKCILVFDCNFEEDGYIRKVVNDLMKVRNMYKNKAEEYKIKYKETQDEEYNKQAILFSSRDNEQKITINSIYGMFGNRYYETGDLPIAIFVTAIGRWLMEQMLIFFGSAVIEVDTDGCILDRNLLENENVDHINDYLKTRIKDFFGIPSNKINFNLKFEDNGSLYIHGKKNYIFLREGEEDISKVQKKGSAFTGYDKAPVLLRAVDIMSQNVMKVGKYKDISFEEASRLALDIHNLPKEMFKFSKTVKKEITDYKGSASLMAHIDRLPEDIVEDFKLLKKEVLTWLGNNNKDKIRTRYRSLVQSTRNMSSLWLTINLISEDIGEKRGTHFMIDMLNRRISRGQSANIDDVLEYYMVRNSYKYAAEDEIKDENDINYDKYIELIERSIKLFSYADDTMEKYNIF
jgi:DNA polymerase elongation subunit (family B)